MSHLPPNHTDSVYFNVYLYLYMCVFVLLLWGPTDKSSAWEVHTDSCTNSTAYVSTSSSFGSKIDTQVLPSTFCIGLEHRVFPTLTAGIRGFVERYLVNE